MEKRKTSDEKTKKSVGVKKLSALTKDGYGLNKVNNLGYPLNDPYGLVAAFCNTIAPMTIFGNKNATD